MTETFPANEKRRVKITDLKAIGLQNTGGQSLIRVETDAGIHGVGEAGTSGPIARAYLKVMERFLIGQDPLDIELLYERMMGQQHPYRPHIPTVSGVDIALWDIAGKLLGCPISKLLAGRFRDAIRLYINSGPGNMLDKEACRAWADRLRESEEGWHTVKLGFEGILRQKSPHKEFQTGRRSQMLTQTELEFVRRGFENCREALGFDIDFIVHCHNEWDLPSAIGITEATASSKPLWIEDPLPVTYSDAWKSLKTASPVRIETGEKLESAAEFLQFLSNQAVDVIQPDIAFAGGITGLKQLAHLADLFNIPFTTHNVGTLVQTMATAHLGACCRNFVMTESRISQLQLIHEMGEEKPQVSNGTLQVPDKPGLGITLIDDVLRENLAADEPFWD